MSIDALTLATHERKLAVQQSVERIREAMAGCHTSIVEKIQSLLSADDCPGLLPAPSHETVTVARCSDTSDVTVTWDAPRVTLSYDEEEETRTSITCGPFTVTVAYCSNTSDVQCIVEPLESAERDATGRYCHPHASDGELCLGEARTAVIAAMTVGDYDLARELVESVLATYYPDSAYITSEEMWHNGEPSCPHCGNEDCDYDGDIEEWQCQLVTCNVSGELHHHDDVTTCDECDNYVHPDCTRELAGQTICTTCIRASL